MLKFKNGDIITVVGLNTTIDDREGMFLGGVGEIVISSETNAYPYEIRFFQKNIQDLNIELGSRLFDENELRLA